MATGQLSAALRQIERLFTAGSVSGMNEGQLLERFASRGDEAAFAALMARHGPMVLGVCRQWLRDPNDVEDAFQATFLVLVRKAGSLRRRDLLGNWLYGVASRVACRARAVSARRQGVQGADVETLATDRPAPPEPHPWLHEEVARLPEKYRAPIVLCYLEGLTHEEAADRLGWPLGTVKGRLARARDLLRSRLTRRGIVLPAAGLAVQLGRDASAAIPAPLAETTTKAALALAAGRASAVGLISAPVAVLLKGTLHAMTLSKLKLFAVPFMIASAVVTGAAVLADPTQDGEKRPAPAPGAPVAESKESSRMLDMMKALGAPHADADLQDARQAALSRVEMAREALRTFTALDDEGRLVPDAEKISQWSLRLMEAESELARTPEDRLKAVEGHLARMKTWEKKETDFVKEDGSRTPRFLILDWQYRRMQAERLVAEAKTPNADHAAPGDTLAVSPNAPAAAPARKGVDVRTANREEARKKVQEASDQPKAKTATKTAQAESATGRAASGSRQGMGGMGGGGMGGMGGGMGGMGGMGGGMGRVGIDPALAMKRMQNERRVEIAVLAPKAEEVDKAPKTQQILKKLNEPISMSFANETPLEDVLKYIKSATSGPNDVGIPVYVDPTGLAEAEKTLTSPVMIDLEGVPLKTTLRLMLKQLGLAYCVKDGLLIISSVDGILQELKEFATTHPEIGISEVGGFQ